MYKNHNYFVQFRSFCPLLYFLKKKHSPEHKINTIIDINLQPALYEQAFIWVASIGLTNPPFLNKIDCIFCVIALCFGH